MSMKPSLSTGELKLLARKGIKEGNIPCVQGKLFAGYDGAEPCALCQRRIEAGDVMYEIQCVHPRTRALHFHIPCHEAWEDECARISQADAESIP
jgi:hypothetical protein